MTKWVDGQEEELLQGRDQVPDRVPAQPGSVRVRHRRDHHDDPVSEPRRGARRPPGADRAAAPRLSLGSRADRAHDRPAHRRGGLRGCRCGDRRGRRQACGRARRPALPGLLPRPAPVGEGPTGDLEDVARGVHEKLVRRHPHVFGGRRARHRRAKYAAAGSQQARPGRSRRDLPRRAGVASCAALCAQGAAACCGGRLRVSGHCRRARGSRRRGARAEGGTRRGRRDRLRRRSRPRMSSPRWETCSSRPSTLRGA